MLRERRVVLLTRWRGVTGWLAKEKESHRQLLTGQYFLQRIQIFLRPLQSEIYRRSTYVNRIAIS